MPAVLQKYFGQLVFLGLLLGGVLITVYALFPAGAWASRGLQKEIRAYLDLRHLKEGKGLADSLNTLRAAAEKSRSFKNVLPKGSKGSYVLEQLVSGAKAAGLEIEDISSLDVIHHKSHVEYPFSLGIKGNFPKLQQWILQLENNRLAFGVRRLDVAAESLNKPGITAIVEVSAYAFAE